VLVAVIKPCLGEECPQCHPQDAKDTQTHVDEAVSLHEWEKELAEEAVKRAATGKKPGNREREAIFRALCVVEKALSELPTGHAQVAGFLQGRGHVGGVKGGDNALQEYLQHRVNNELAWNMAHAAGHDVKVFAESGGTIVESGRYMVCIDPEPWQEMFLLRLRQGDFPELLHDRG